MSDLSLENPGTPAADTAVVETPVTDPVEIVAPSPAEDPGIDVSPEATGEAPAPSSDPVSEAKEEANAEPAVEAPVIELPIAEAVADPIVLAEESPVVPEPVAPIAEAEPVVEEPKPADSVSPVEKPTLAEGVPTVTAVKDANGMVIRWEFSITFPDHD